MGEPKKVNIRFQKDMDLQSNVESQNLEKCEWHVSVTQNGDGWDRCFLFFFSSETHCIDSKGRPFQTECRKQSSRPERLLLFWEF